MSPSPATRGVERGYIIPIGGAEDHDENPVILKRFADLCGGPEASIVIIPTASQLRDTGSRYIETFDELGIGQAVSIPIKQTTPMESARLIWRSYRMPLASSSRAATSCGSQPFWAARLWPRPSGGSTHKACMWQGPRRVQPSCQNT